MFGFRKKDKTAPSTPETSEGSGLLARLRDRLGRTRGGLVGGLADLFGGGRAIDDELLEELENRLLAADVGIEATERVISDLTSRVSRRELADGDALLAALRDDLAALLAPVDEPLVPEHDGDGPFVILMAGINGAGKTTTIGKLAQRFTDEGRSVVLGAADTFRAAAAEQLESWGERTGVPVIRGPEGSDPGAVAHDAAQAARARNADVLIIDTAGRLHTQSNLMDELAKVRRVIDKQLPGAPHEVLLVLDGGTGQNALNQARQFHEALGVTGLTITKLDGTAKGGVLFALATRLGLPIRFIGVGESAADLRPFNAADFVDAILGP